MRKLSAKFAITMLAVAATLPCAATPAVSPQRHFPTPERAVEQLIAADRANNQAELASIFGSEGIKLIRSGDPIADQHGRERFVVAYDQAHEVKIEAQDRAILIVGQQQWPLPIPLIREPAGWRFDIEAGAQEILDRRIGRNELHVIEVCRAYVKAQREYAALKLNGQPEFALRIISTPGHHDGLYWPVQPGDPPSPLGPLVAQAQVLGYAPDRAAASPATPRPFYGYYFRLLSAQGPNAAGGAKQYLSGGHMTQGFALIAYPASYGDSGITTFIVNQSGIVFEKDLGADSTRIALQVSRYDPDTSWRTP